MAKQDSTTDRAASFSPDSGSRQEEWSGSGSVDWLTQAIKNYAVLVSATTGTVGLKRTCIFQFSRKCKNHAQKVAIFHKISFRKQFCFRKIFKKKFWDFAKIFSETKNFEKGLAKTKSIPKLYSYTACMVHPYGIIFRITLHFGRTKSWNDN
jgi:hypothetical protein